MKSLTTLSLMLIALELSLANPVPDQVHKQKRSLEDTDLEDDARRLLELLVEMERKDTTQQIEEVEEITDKRKNGFAVEANEEEVEEITDKRKNRLPVVPYKKVVEEITDKRKNRLPVVPYKKALLAGKAIPTIWPYRRDDETNESEVARDERYVMRALNSLRDLLNTVLS